jgi:hypothetical protein
MVQDQKQKSKNKTLKVVLSALVLFFVAAIIIISIEPEMIFEEKPASVVIVSSSDSMGRLGELKLTAVLDPSDRELRRDKPYEWSASSGRISGKGKEVTLHAPNELGQITVSLKVHTKKKEVVQDSKTISVVAYDMKYEEGAVVESETQPTVRKISMKNREGYEIQDVWVEKDRICLNEDFRVKVKAVDPDGSNKWLTIRTTYNGVGEQFGPEVVMRPSALTVDSPELRKKKEGILKVDLFDFRQRQLKASYQTKVVLEECEKQEAGLRVKCSKKSNPFKFRCSVEDWKFQDVLVEAFEWRMLEVKDSDFPIVTEVPYWDYEIPFRTAERLTDNYTIEVEAIFKDGQKKKGRGTLSITHFEFMVRQQSQVLQLIVHYRWPKEEDGKVNLDISVMNPYAETIYIDRIDQSRINCKDKKRSIAEGTVSARELIGTDSLVSGEVYRGTFSVPVDRERCVAHLQFIGRGAESDLPVSGWVNLMTVPDLVRDTPISMGEINAMREALSIQYLMTGKRSTSITQGEIEHAAKQFNYMMKKFLQEEIDKRNLDIESMSREEKMELEKELKRKVYKHLRETGPAAMDFQPAKDQVVPQ